MNFPFPLSWDSVMSLFVSLLLRTVHRVLALDPRLKKRYMLTSDQGLNLSGAHLFFLRERTRTQGRSHSRSIKCRNRPPRTFICSIFTMQASVGVATLTFVAVKGTLTYLVLTHSFEKQTNKKNLLHEFLASWVSGLRLSRMNIVAQVVRRLNQRSYPGKV